MVQQLVKFWKDEEGATAVEYALIAGLIAVAIIVSVEAMGGQISALFGRISAELQGVTPGA